MSGSGKDEKVRPIDAKSEKAEAQAKERSQLKSEDDGIELNLDEGQELEGDYEADPFRPTRKRKRGRPRLNSPPRERPTKSTKRKLNWQ